MAQHTIIDLEYTMPNCEPLRDDAILKIAGFNGQTLKLVRSGKLSFDEAMFLMTKGCTSIEDYLDDPLATQDANIISGEPAEA